MELDPEPDPVINPETARNVNNVEVPVRPVCHEVFVHQW
jgi:hypothetical protein